jgi:hypothetical protein
MAISQYSGFVPVCLQLLGGLKTVLQKAEEHATAQRCSGAARRKWCSWPSILGMTLWLSLSSSRKIVTLCPLGVGQ